jgi:hypothetical protein
LSGEPDSRCHACQIMGRQPLLLPALQHYIFAKMVGALRKPMYIGAQFIAVLL